MVRSALSKVAWAGRTAAMVFGLALVLALLFGVATMALAAVPGDPFKLGRLNSINAITRLAGANSSVMLKVNNDGSGSALGLEVKQGEPPMRVNSDKKVTNLNADEVDGSDAPLWAGVNTNGTLSRSKGVDGSVKGPTGIYNISFDRDVSQCVYVATLTDFATGEISVTQDAVNPRLLHVTAWTSAGSAADKPFYLVVLC